MRIAGGRPPNARTGAPGSSAGRRIITGLAPFERRLSPRATDSDLWASVEAAFTEPRGFERLEKLHGIRLDKQGRLRSRAFLNQARQYYGAIANLEPVAKPLLAYYFALNMAKAFLTVVDPAVTVGAALQHGLQQDYHSGPNYSFKRERFKVQGRGVFRLLAERTGMRHCLGGELRLGSA